MRIVLADLASADGFVSKDTVVGGYGSRLQPFSRMTRRRVRDETTSARPAQRAAGIPGGICARRPGTTSSTRRAGTVDGDVAIVLTSLVDYRHEAAWADVQRERGLRVGFVGLDGVEAAGAVRGARATS